MDFSDLVSLCLTASRVRYFDADFVQEMWRAFRKRIQDGAFTIEQLTDIISAFRELNAYDAGLFHAAAQAAAPQIPNMSREQRLLWIELYDAVSHQGDGAFMARMRTMPGLEREQPKDVGSDGRIPCRHFIKGYCWLGKSCSFSHEPGLRLPPQATTVMLNGLQARQSDTYRAVGGLKTVLM
mmetsp:Transcript_33929/g.104337  ORF Transcript_33929/g.104337 Transcript_33929/m.104337 type:complete len:182 (-) Transcript_33929:340-885(-)